MFLSPIIESAESLRTIRVAQGLFVLRYVSSRAGLNSPVVAVSASSGSGVQVIGPSDENANLASPGDALVIKAARDSFITVSVTPSIPNGSRDAELVLERVSTSVRRLEKAEMMLDQPKAHVGSQALGDLEILAHVARRGDVLVRAGEWVCGPQVPMAIEGLELRWNNKPSGVDIVSRATVNARSHHELPEQPTGKFLGTRGRAAPITSLAMTLVGPGSSGLSLKCDALFLGLSVKTVSGRSCEVSGTTGHEPLVGLRVVLMSALDKAADQSLKLMRAQQTKSPPSMVVPALAERTGRVRIFRRQTEQGVAGAISTK
jgi:hypothetical protein